MKVFLSLIASLVFSAHFSSIDPIEYAMKRTYKQNIFLLNELRATSLLYDIL